MFDSYMKRELKRKQPEAVGQAKPEPPVVARLLVEIRSDGSRTIARGLAEKDVPALARNFAKGFLPGRKV